MTLHIFMWAMTWGSVVIFRSQEGPQTKKYGKYWHSYQKWKVEEKLQAHYIHPGGPVVSSSNISYLQNFNTLLSVHSALRPKQPPLHRIREAISYQVKQPEHEADHSVVQRLRMSAAKPSVTHISSWLTQEHILLVLSVQKFHDEKELLMLAFRLQFLLNEFLSWGKEI
jgi:hypothetical protein